MRQHKHGLRLAAVLGILMLFTACITPRQTRQIQAKPADIPPLVELESVPFYPQRAYQCGPAALAMVLNNYQELISPAQLMPLVYVPALKGSLRAEMLAVARRFNYLAIVQDGKLTSVLREVAVGHPVLVMQNLGLAAYPYWHYAVVIGYDLHNQVIILRSGRTKRLVRSFSVFERTWQRAENWSVVMVPIGFMPISANEITYREAAIELENSATPENMVKAYQTGLARWPRSFILQMGLGNAAFAIADYVGAEVAFRAATQVHPKKPQAWNNLAYALAKLNKKQAALRAIDQAMVLAPEQQQYIDSKKEILANRVLTSDH